MQRYFSDKRQDNRLVLSKDDLYHIKTVMRMKDNDEIIVVNDNIPYLCCLENVNSNIEIIIKRQLEKEDNNIPFVRMIVPVLKEQKMDYILQKATELGAEEIVLYEASRSVVKIKDNIDKKILRWQKIVKEASEQCHRNNIPNIEGVLKIKQLEEFDGLKILCSTREKSKNIKNILKLYATYDKINIVIGPEGGLDQIEEEKFIEMGFIPTTLGSRIMRAETVPLFILSTINYEFME